MGKSFHRVDALLQAVEGDEIAAELRGTLLLNETEESNGMVVDFPRILSGLPMWGIV